MNKLLTFLTVLAALTFTPKTFAGDLMRLSGAHVVATPTVTASSAYSTGNQMGGIQTLANVALDSRGYVNLYGVEVVDIDKQNTPMDIFFFNTLPTFTSADHAAWALSGPNALLCIGKISIVAGDWTSSAAQGFADPTSGAPGKLMWAALPVAKTGQVNTTLYAVAVARGTPTYTTTTSLQFRYKFQQF